MRCKGKNGSLEFPEQDDGFVSAENGLFQEMSSIFILTDYGIIKRKNDSSRYNPIHPQ